MDMDIDQYKLLVRYWFNRTAGPYLSRYESSKKMLSFLKEKIPSFMNDKFFDNSANKRLLVASMGSYDAKTEAVYAKALESLGYETYIITKYDPFIDKIFHIFGIKNIYYYDNYFLKVSSQGIISEAANLVQKTNTKDILKMSKDGVQVGKYAASSVMRQTRKSSFDMKNNEMKSIFEKQLIRSLRALKAIEMILDEIKPDLVWVNDRGYSPVGQLFDLCMQRGIPVIQRCGAHKSGWEVLKRYSSPEMGTIHHHSLSRESWEYMKEMPWDQELWKELFSELECTYKSGDWFSEVGTQFNKIVFDKKEILSELNIDSQKKTAIIYPHIFWDATFFWGEDLFKDYHDWFVNVLRVAAENTNLNWIIKVHPANIVKARRDNYHGGHGELKVIHKTLGQIPDHIKIIPPESNINTFSLFDIMDYCLTVRGTIGIESAAMGINTLIAGTGRYDRLGFTHDFDSKEDYLDCIRSLEKMPPMTEKAIELARRYAYGVFILRSIHLDLLEHGFNQDDKGTMKFKPLFRNRQEFEDSGFVKGLRSFVSSGREDYLNSLDLPHIYNKVKSCVE